MKRIHFDKYCRWKKILLLAPATIFLIFSFVISSDSETHSLRYLFLVLGNGLIIILLGRNYIYKNYAGWNRRGMYLKINSFFFGKNLLFKTLTSVKCSDDILTLTDVNKRRIKLNLKEFDKQDLERLVLILKRNIS